MADFTDYLYQMAQQPGYDPETADQTTQPTVADLGAAANYYDPTSSPMATAPAPDPTGGVDPNTPPTPAPTGGVDPNGAAPQEIDVTGNKAAPASVSGFSLPMTAADQDPDAMKSQAPGDNQAPYATPQQIASTKDLQGLPDHQGMFGVHGTLRNILGTLGDAFLVQGGAAPVYAQKRQQEKEGDALVGFAQDPAAAIGRLAAVDPKAAIAYRAQLANENLAGDRIRQTAATAGQRIGLQQGSIGAKTYGQIAAAYAQAPAGSPQREQLAAQAQAAKARYGLTDDQFPALTDDNAAAQAVANTPAVVQNQQKIDETARNHLVTEATGASNAQSHAIQARASAQQANVAAAREAVYAKVAGSKNPPQQTVNAVLGQAASLMAAGKQLTPGMQAVVARFGPKQSGLPSLGTPTAPAPTSQAPSTPLGIPMGGGSQTAAPTPPPGAHVQGLTPQQKAAGYIMWNGQLLRPKQR